MIQNKSDKSDKKWLRRAADVFSAKYLWIKNQSEATLFATASDASVLVDRFHRFCDDEKYSQESANKINYSLEVIKVNLTLTKVYQVQPEDYWYLAPKPEDVLGE